MNNALITHLQAASPALRVPRRGPVDWADEATHTAAFAADPQRYALFALVPGASEAQRARVLLTLLSASWKGLETAVLHRVVRVLVLGLPGPRMLAVLLAARRRRANHKHVTRAAVTALCAHPQADTLVATHRKILVDCLEHALGKSTCRGVVKRLGTDAAYVHRHFLRFASDPDAAARRLLALYAGGAVAPSPASPALDLDLDGPRPDTVTATNRGDIAATIVHLMRGGPAADLESALDGYVDAEARSLPVYPGRLAIVLDASTSMRGYGDREWAVWSQAVALRLVLGRCCADLAVVQAGGDVPAGPTDLASALLDALRADPDLVAVVSDGYENVYPGDLAAVVAALPGAGVTTPVVFCQAAFGHSDDLTLRRPAPDLPQRAFWHQRDLAGLLIWLLAHARGAAADEWLRETLHRRLDDLEGSLR